MKKGRHRRFEEARKLKQIGPDFLFSEPAPPAVVRDEDDDVKVDDEYADIAARYGAFDDEDDESDSEEDDRH